MSASVDEPVLTMKTVERKVQYGWESVEFECLMIGDEFRVVTGHKLEIGRVYRVMTEPKACEPSGNFGFQAEVVSM